MMKVRDLPKNVLLVSNTQDVNYILRYHLGRTSRTCSPFLF